MIIVEQEKTYLVNFENVEYISLAVDEENTEYAIMATIKNDGIIMGIYKTEERAKEVLQEVIRRSRDLCYLVYEMPEK